MNMVPDLETCRELASSYLASFKIPFFHKLSYMHMEDSLDTQRRLRRGQIVWAAVVQANNGLYRPGKTDLPGMVVFSFKPYFDKFPDHLLAIATRLFQLKNTKPKERITAEFAQAISNERSNFQNEPVPYHLADGHVVFASVFFGFRYLFPGGILKQRLFPIIASDFDPHPLILPKEFWSESLHDYWNGKTSIDSQQENWIYPAPPGVVPERQGSGEPISLRLEEFNKLANLHTD